MIQATKPTEDYPHHKSWWFQPFFLIYMYIPYFCPKPLQLRSFLLLSPTTSIQSFAEPKSTLCDLWFDLFFSLLLDLTRVMRCCQEKAISWTCLTLYPENLIFFSRAKAIPGSFIGWRSNWRKASMTHESSFLLLSLRYKTHYVSVQWDQAIFFLNGVVP